MKYNGYWCTTQSKPEYETLDQAKEQCSKDGSCEMIYYYGPGYSTPFIICTSPAKKMCSSSTDTYVYVKKGSHVFWNCLKSLLYEIVINH